jgi:ribonuclease P protein component
MIAFKNRFHGHGSLKYIYTHGKTVRTRLMTLRYSRHPKRKDPRIAVVISKKVIKGAIGRNRVRRRVYEIVRQELPLIEPNSDIVFIIFSAEVRELPQIELVQSVKQMLESADVYKKQE